MKILAIDTSAHLCSVCVFDSSSNTDLAFLSENIGRGHAELLMPMIEECLKRASMDFGDLDRIAVVKGPGSFAGLRVGIATAKGLAISLGLPIIGVGSLAAIAQSAQDIGYTGKLLTILSAKRGEFYFRIDTNSSDQQVQAGLATLDVLCERVAGNDVALCGAGAATLNQALGAALPVIHELDAPDIRQVAKIGALEVNDFTTLEPVYFRPPDIKPQAGFVLPRA